MYTGVHGQLLEVTVVGCTDLRDKEWLSRQDPYVVVEYANNRLRTRTHTDGGKHPSFNDKFTISLVEGLAECNLQAWNSNTVTADDLIGSGRVNLAKVLASGYDDNTWPLSTGNGRHAGYVRLIMHYKPLTSSTGVGKVGKVGKGEHGAAPTGYGPPHGTSGYPAPTGYPPSKGLDDPHHGTSGYPAPAGYPPSKGLDGHGYGTSGYPPNGYPPPSGYPSSGYPHSAPGYPATQHVSQGHFEASFTKPGKDFHAAATHGHHQSAPYGYHHNPPPTHGFYQQAMPFAPFPGAPAPVIPAAYPTAHHGSHGHYGGYSQGKHKEGKKKKKGKK